MSASQETLLEIITESPLSATTKDFFAKKIKKEGATQENIIALRELLRAVKRQTATDMGIQVDPNDPKLKAAQADMHTNLQAASDKYAQTMKRLEAEAARLTSDIQEDLKHLEKIVVDSAKAEA
jgi:RecJ-like exonuclease